MDSISPTSPAISTGAASRLPTQPPSSAVATSTVTDVRNQPSPQARATRVKANDVFTALRDPARSNTEKSTLLIDAITNGLDNVNAQDRLKGTGMEKWSILHHAVNLDSPAALKAVLQAPHIKLHTIDKSGSSPLHLAAKCGNDSAVASLLDKQRQLHPDDAKTLAQYVNTTNQACRTPMHLAATAPEGVKVMQRLFDAGGTVDPSTRTGLSTPLSYAVKAFANNRAQSLEASKWLISKGANAETPLLINKTNRSVAEAQARQNVKSNFTSPLEIAKDNNWSSLIRVLDPNSTLPVSERSSPVPSVFSQDSIQTTSKAYVPPANTTSPKHEAPLLINKTSHSVAAAEASQKAQTSVTPHLETAEENNWSPQVQILDLSLPTPVSAGSSPISTIFLPDSTHAPSSAYVDPVNTITLEGEFGHVLSINPGQEVIQSYAIRLCNDCFDKEASLRNCFYASEDPYYIAMDLRNNEGLDTNDVDSIDTLRDCRERFVEDKTSWIEAAMDNVCEIIHKHVSSPPKDLSEAYADLRTGIDSFFVDEAYGLMQETIRAQFGNRSDSD